MSGGFRFLDDTDAQRQLGVDRLTFEELIRSGRLTPVSRTGSLSFYRAKDIARLRAELNPESEDEDTATALPAPESAAPAPTKPARKQHDPAMRVHLRLAADLKWYDIAESDIQAWFDQTVPDAYERYRANAQFIIGRMERVIQLIDAGERRFRDAAPATGSDAEGGA